jgi:putative colanic acid biosynthesis glycosyltransferase WcaI
MRDMGLLGNPGVLALLTSYARYCYRRADLATTVTQIIVDDLVQRQVAPADKVVLLPNGADSNGPTDNTTAERLVGPLFRPGQRLALCVGTHGYIHGMEVLLEAAAAMADRPDLVFLLVGDGSKKARLVELARSRSLPNLYFADPVPPAAVPALYRRAAAGLCALRDVPIAATVRLIRALNAMDAEVPVVYAGHGEGAALVQRTRAGIVTPPGDGLPTPSAPFSPIRRRRTRWGPSAGTTSNPICPGRRSWRGSSRSCWPAAWRGGMPPACALREPPRAEP